MKRPGIILLQFFIMGIPLIAFGQRELLHRQVEPLEKVALSGPGSEKHHFFYFNFGLKPDVIETKVSRTKASSNAFSFGISNKYRIGDHISLLHRQHYKRVSNRFKPSYFLHQLAGDSLLNEQQIVQHFLGIDLAIRYNYGPVGNAYGNFIQIGFWADYLVWSKYAWISRGSEKTESIFLINALSDSNEGVNLWSIGGQLKFGFGWFSIFSNYRLTDYFQSASDDDPATNDLRYNVAPLTVGVEFVLFRLD